MTLLPTVYPVSGRLCKYRLVSKCFYYEYSRFVQTCKSTAISTTLKNPTTANGRNSNVSSTSSNAAGEETKKKRKGKKRMNKRGGTEKGKEIAEEEEAEDVDTSTKDESSSSISVRKAVTVKDKEQIIESGVGEGSKAPAPRNQKNYPTTTVKAAQEEENPSKSKEHSTKRETTPVTTLDTPVVASTSTAAVETDDGDNNSSTCMICLETPTRYGLLLGCNHPFCIGCIHSYRQTQRSTGLSGTWAPQNIQDAPPTDDVCPVCRTKSEIVVPHSRFVPNGPQKRELTRAYRQQLKSRPCRHFTNSAQTYCPFGRDCFFSHKRFDGSEAHFVHTLDDTRRRRMFSSFNPLIQMLPPFLAFAADDGDEDDEDDWVDEYVL